MKIAVLGARGFVGSSLTKHLSVKHNVVPVIRSTVDLLEYQQVFDFLKKEKFDIIINAAAVMTDPTSFADTRNNLGIFMNFFNSSGMFEKFINLGSGAEFDRSMNIENISEDQIFKRMPEDSYGFGQNIKSRLCLSRKNFYTLRLFNCFGQGEYPSRIFPKFVSKQNEQTFDLQNDRYFDYFSITDLCKVIDYYINEDPIYPDINCVYKDKYKISQVLEKFVNEKKLKNNINIVSTSTNNYTGDYKKLYSCNIELDGLVKGLKNYVFS